MTTRSFFHSFQREGCQATITIEWSAPEDTDMPAEWAQKAEDVASDIISTGATRLKELVGAMRGRTFEPEPPPSDSTEWQA